MRVEEVEVDCGEGVTDGAGCGRNPRTGGWLVRARRLPSAGFEIRGHALFAQLGKKGVSPNFSHHFLLLIP